MKEVDTKLFTMYNMLDLSDSYRFSQFKNADKNHLQHIPWLLKGEVETYKGRRKRPKIRFLGTQDVVYKQLYRYFIGDLPEQQLVPINARDDYNPWHWDTKRVTAVVQKKPAPPEKVIVPETPTELEPALAFLAETIQTRILHGKADPWFEVDEMYSQEEMDQVREFLNAN